MDLLSEIEGRLLVLMSQGRRAGRVRVPAARRTELESLMRRSQGARRDNEIPMHIMGVMVYFEGDDLAIE